MYACIINIYVPHEVKYQRALAKRASQIKLNGQDVNILMGISSRQYQHNPSHARHPPPLTRCKNDKTCTELIKIKI